MVVLSDHVFWDSAKFLPNAREQERKIEVICKGKLDQVLDPLGTLKRSVILPSDNTLPQDAGSANRGCITELDRSVL